MAQVKLIKLDTLGLPTEMDSAADDITLASYTVTGGGPVLNANLDMNNGNISDAGDLAFTDPTTDGITNTAGTIAADDLMANDITNTMTSTGDIIFPDGITDVAGEVDALKVPSLAGVPTATPTNGTAGHLVYDNTNDNMYVWTGTEWDNMNTVSAISNLYTADEALTNRDAVYISAADNVSACLADDETTCRFIGFAGATVIDTASVEVYSEGLLDGFTGLTAGSRYYCDASTAGAITATAPSGGGNIVYQVGFAKSATELQIQPQFLGKKAV